MREEIRVFFTALMFYTRIPCPKWVDHSEEYINKSIRYFPLIGWIVGTIASSGFLIGSFLINDLFGIIVYFIFSVLATGAFHEDGFADVCDGFGGGWTKDKILTIMKDSRVGAYGVIGIILLFLFKLSVLMEFLEMVSAEIAMLVFISIHAVSRLIAATFVFTHDYVRDTPDSKVKPVAKASNKSNLTIAFLFGILPLLFVSYFTKNYLLLTLLPVLYLIKMRLAVYFKKWIGGYTGDCLGATQQIAEAGAYLFVTVLWKFT